MVLTAQLPVPSKMPMSPLPRARTGIAAFGSHEELTIAATASTDAISARFQLAIQGTLAVTIALPLLSCTRAHGSFKSRVRRPWHTPENVESESCAGPTHSTFLHDCAIR